MFFQAMKPWLLLHDVPIKLKSRMIPRLKEDSQQ